jgi:pyruvate,water dikinase
MTNEHSWVWGFQDIDRAKIKVAGGKGANLGELARIKGILVPDGFCVSTEAFKKIMEQTPVMKKLLDALLLLKAEERDKISQLSHEIRAAITATAIPPDITKEIRYFLTVSGENRAYAIRSSATAEDLPTASFAGQQDTYLNIIGSEAILQHIRLCWASLFTERAIIYRIQNGFDHSQVYLSVVVQQMVFPQVSGILFTADPVTGHRKTVSIDAGFGLGEAFVSGLVNADTYRVRNGAIIDKKIAVKKRATGVIKTGGIQEHPIAPEQQHQQALTDEQILQLTDIGKKIEAHFGQPQDIEWCLAEGMFYIVQSRPVTTLYPIPEAGDLEKHVYLSVGHQQMMTDPMRPLGLSVWQHRAFTPMYKAGGRLFVDVLKPLSIPVQREALIKGMGQHDPLIKDAILTIVNRGDFIPATPGDEKMQAAGQTHQVETAEVFNAPIENDPAIPADLIRQNEEWIEKLKYDIRDKSGVALFDFILDDLAESKKIITDTRSMSVIMTAINASNWINEKLEAWLGEKNAVDVLSQSAPNNITSQMGLDLLEVADVIRPYPEVMAFLQQVKDDNFLDKLPEYQGGKEAQKAILAYLDTYGMRCVGEIDITRTRWSEKPSILIPMIVSNIRNFEAGASRRKFEQGQQEALKKEQEVLARLRLLPDGGQKAAEVQRVISIVRNFIGYREYPKYGIVRQLFVYKQALMKEAGQLQKARIIEDKEDVFYLTFEEFREAVRTQQVDYKLINARKEEFKHFEKLKPPRVITSDGEIVTGAYKRENLPANALIGLPVSSGLIEGRARVILNIEDAILEENDILVTAFTDPSWTPLFVSIKGLVTEVGGLMTHGAVIAREYGLPAVVGVENATRLIQDGQQIRVHGTEGYIEIL